MGKAAVNMGKQSHPAMFSKEYLLLMHRLEISNPLDGSLFNYNDVIIFEVAKEFLKINNIFEGPAFRYKSARYSKREKYLQSFIYLVSIICIITITTFYIQNVFYRSNCFCTNTSNGNIQIHKRL